jgi:hypothetical protein
MQVPIGLGQHYGAGLYLDVLVNDVPAAVSLPPQIGKTAIGAE